MVHEGCTQAFSDVSNRLMPRGLFIITLRKLEKMGWQPWLSREPYNDMENLGPSLSLVSVRASA